MMSQTPFRHDRAPARDDTANAIGGQVNIGQTHARMDGEIIDALLALFNQSVAVDFPCEVFGDAAHFLEGLVNRHSPDGHGRVADNPFARVMDVAARGQVHDIIRAPTCGPDHVLNFFLNGRCHSRVADIGVDFHEEVSANDCLLYTSPSPRDRQKSRMPSSA